MAELWFYTNEGKQMDAVPIRELKKLVGDGVLKPTDMVWKEGLPRWIRASSVKELFPDPTSTLDKYFTNTPGSPQQGPQATGVTVPAGSTATPTTNESASPPVEEDEPREKKKRRSSGADQEEDNRRPRRRSEAASGGGSNTGLMIFVGLGAVVLLFFLCGGLAIMLYIQEARPANLVQNKNDDAKPVGGDRKDVAKPPPGKDEPAKDKDAPKPKDPLLPKDVLVGNGHHQTGFIQSGGTVNVKFQVKAGHAARLTASAQGTKANPWLSLTVVKESDNAEIARTDKPQVTATVNFAAPITETIVLRIKNEGKTSIRCSVVYDVGAK
ncbi:MAG: DUF4339 domain-containing protein [Gemmataceae bacterium]|nr:DUF4339 domain-containing protein [Gemmataceae bacterium]